MATSGPRLTAEQRDILCGWLAADYGDKIILHWIEEQGWPAISRQAVQYHRTRFRVEIEERRKERHARALTTGLALKEERVERLKENADELDAIKWVPDEKGRLWNEKAWRENLDEIAREMGHRSTGVNLNVQRMPDDELIAEVRRALDPAAAGDDGGGAAPGSEGDPGEL